MPMVMERTDWMRSVTDAGRTGQLFYETVTDQSGSLSFSFPQGGCYKVFIVKEDGNDDQPVMAEGGVISFAALDKARLEGRK